MKRTIKKAAVVGSGIMGSGIACHLANIGVQVLLLDIVPRELTEKEKAAGLDLSHPKVRNRLVQDHFNASIKSKPAPLYHSSFASRITLGNTEDDLHKIKDVDWIIEVVVERLDIKKIVFEQIEKHRKPGTLITSNTSGIPIHLMLEGRSEDFQKHFCGTHFFNPPRYLKLFEIIPTPKTDPSVISFFDKYGSLYLGKNTVIAKDTPAFIANRVGTFSIMNLFHTVKELGINIADVDKLTGPVIGRAKSATFRTVDVVGLDTLMHVAKGIQQACPNDEKKDSFVLPDYISKMMENNWLGSKTKQGFYKKTKDENGKKEILSLNLETLEYEKAKKTRFSVLEKTKKTDDLNERYKLFAEDEELAGQFFRKNMGALFAYSSNRLPEIADHLYQIDDALRAGFAWKHGPFQIWDGIGVEKGIEILEKEGEKAADWVKEMIQKGITSFYHTDENGTRFFYNIEKKEYEKIPGQESFIILDNVRKNKTIWKNDGASIIDLGDGIINLEFQSKMNTLGQEVIMGLNKAIDLAEKEYEGLVIANNGDNFSVGANIGMIFMMAVEQDYDELNMAINMFQKTMMRARYSSIPVVVAPFNMTLGGGCELNLHADKIVASSELYMGMVEFGVGVIPGGGGSKEMTVRTSDMFRKGDVEVNVLQENFMNIATAKVSTSAYEAQSMNYLRKGHDLIVVNQDRLIATAKREALAMAENGYTRPIERTDIKVLGKKAIGMFHVGIDSMKAAHYISEHDAKIANKLAYVMAGGDLSESTKVSEQYLLDIEREAFLSLCTEKKSLERIQHMLKTGKPLRN